MALFTFKFYILLTLLMSTEIDYLFKFKDLVVWQLSIGSNQIEDVKHLFLENLLFWYL